MKARNKNISRKEDVLDIMPHQKTEDTKVTPEDEAREIQRIKKLRSRLYQTGHVGTYTLTGGLPIIPRSDISTYATDGQKIYANIEFSKSLSDLEVTGIIIHESLHIGLRHHFRMAPLIEAGVPEDVIQEGLDYVVNAMIIQSPNYGTDFSLPDNVLYDPKYSGWASEKVIKDLMKNPPPPPPPPPPPGRKRPPGRGRGRGPGGAVEKTQEKGKGKGKGPAKGPPTVHRVGDVLPAPELKEGDEATNKAKQEIHDRIQDASLQEKISGHGSGGFISTITDSGSRKTIPSDEIGQFIEKAQSITKTFARPNRRFLQRQMYLPTPKKKHSTLHVCIDTSGSVSVEELKDYLANIIRWAMEFRLDLIRVAYVDSEIHKCNKTDDIWHDIHLNDGSGAHAMELITVGGGGTSFDPIFEAIEEEQEEIMALIYMTDGYGHVSIDEPDYQVLWVTSGCSPNFYGNNLWGDIIYLNR